MCVDLVDVVSSDAYAYQVVVVEESLQVADGAEVNGNEWSDQGWGISGGEICANVHLFGFADATAQPQTQISFFFSATDPR